MNVPETTNILLIGGGGIGSEVAYALLNAFTGNICVIDMDTIELSNLNRQTFFKETDIGEYKAQVLAREISLLSQNRIRTKYYTEAIQTSTFTPNWIKQFTCIISCTDNIKARVHINLLSILSGVPVIESGSAGYQGQTYTMVPAQTECYACNGIPSETQIFPVCTIRGTPTEWIHCVHWAIFAIANTKEDSRTWLDTKLNTEISSILETVTKDKRNTPETLHQIAAVKAREYSIEIPSETVTKNILDKTVPSILSTNSIIGNLIAIQLYNLLHTRILPYIYYLTQYKQILTIGILPANTECIYCTSVPYIWDTLKTARLKDLLSTLSIEKDSSTTIIRNTSLLYDYEYTDNLPQLLSNLSITTGTILNVLTDKTKYLVWVSIK
ncbi:ubiquitin-like 1-activating enzyme E1 B [Nematocida sp. AWRm80]|nr:ubiquitin-like 1-activating enzyme E1 B [Nematocida sp. AWRm80]